MFPPGCANHRQHNSPFSLSRGYRFRHSWSYGISSMLFYLPSQHLKEGAMKYGAVRQQQLFGTVVKDQSNVLSVPTPIQSELIVLLAQLMRSIVDAIEREANDEQNYR